jgi:hypothetical protein
LTYLLAMLYEIVAFPVFAVSALVSLVPGLGRHEATAIALTVFLGNVVVLRRRERVSLEDC